MPTGLGLAPLGTSVYGYGANDTAIAPDKRVLFDATTGTQQNARKIDSRSRQYTYNTNGRIAGMPGVYQRVQVAVQTIRGSSALGLNFGNPNGSIQLITSNIARRIEDGLRLTLKALTDEGLIQILDVTVLDRIGPSGEYALLRWKDLTTEQEETTKV